MLRLAATVMLVRPASSNELEVFMLRRSEASHFVPDVYVFPGGTVEESDFSEHAAARARGLDAAELRAQFRAEAAPGFAAPLGSPEPADARALLIAALRELYEEAGVLLACNADGEPLTDADLAPYRALLHGSRDRVRSGDFPFFELLRQVGAYADAGALALFSHWITPPAFSRRYNAHFFVAQALPEQTAAADTFETHDGVWIAPATALERCRRGDFQMVYPTIKHVERLAQFDDVDALMHFARTKTIYSIMPDVPAEREFSMPAHLERVW